MNDYREVQAYLSHGLFDKKKKQYYKEDYNNKKETPASFVYGKGSIVSKEDGKLYKHGSVSLKDHHSNENTGKKFSGKFLESKSDYTKRVNKRSQDWEQAQEQMIKSANSQFDAKKDIERADTRLPMINKVKKRAKEVLDAYSRIDNAKKDLAKVGNNSAAAQNLKKQIQSAEEAIKNSQYWMFDALTEIDHYHNYGLVNKDEWSKYKEADAAYDKNNFRGCAQKLSEIFHSSLEEEYMNSEYTEINAYLQHGLFDIFKSKPKYNSTGSAAGMPSNIHLGDSYNPTAQAAAIQDEIVRMSKKLAEYENGEVKAKADYDRYKKLVKETKAKLSDLEKARANAVTQSVYNNSKPTTVTSSAPNQTKLVRTNPIFDRDVANLRKKR